MSNPPWHLTAAEARARVPSGEATPFAPMLRHGSMLSGLYAPQGTDNQTPHDQDELYIVVSGSGAFVRGEERIEFGPGDLLFVPAHMEHHFADFTADLETWVVFYGPRRGEAGSPD